MNKKSLFALSITTACALGVAACHNQEPAHDGSGHHEHGDGHHDGNAPKSGGAVKAPGDANVGDTTKCPVSGEEFVVDANSPHAEHNGKTYYFCCSGCKKKFESDPAKFTAAPKS